MAKLTTTDLANLTNQTTAITQINANNALIEAAIENTVSRDGTSPNTMTSSLDMNSNDIINIAALDASSITLDGISILSSLPSVTPRGAWVTSTAYAVGDLVTNTAITYICNTAHTSGTFTTDNSSGYWTTFATLPATVKTPERFSGDGADTTFVLSATPTSEDYITVFIDGVHQNHDQFSLSGATITFTTAPPTGSNNIEVAYTVGSTSFTAGAGTIDGGKLAGTINAGTTPTVWTNMNIDSGSIDGVTVGAASATTGAFTTITGSDLTLSGNLTVNGTTTSLQITNQVTADPLIELNNGASSNANDMGIIMERGSTGDNAFMGWDESGDHFIVATTTATGSSTGNISYSAANLTVAGITATSGTLAGLTSLAMSGGATLTAGFLDEDTMSSNSAVAGVTQQSVKAYVDSKVPAAGIQMTWETATTDTDQGVGKGWLNHATPSSATVMYFDDVENNSVSINSFIDSLDDPTASNSATIYIHEAGTGGAGVVFQVSGAVTSASTYSKVAVTHVATYGTLSDGDTIGVTIAFSGNNGAGSGDMAASNNLSDVASAATAFSNIKQAASASATGVVELATIAETNTGTDTGRAVTPDGLDGWTGSAQVTTTGALGSGTIATGFGAIDNGTSNQTTGGQMSLDVDGSGKNAAGALTLGAGADAGIWFDGTDMKIDTSGSLNFADNTVKRLNLLDFGLVTSALGDLGGGSDTIDLTAGNSVTATVSTGTQTLVFSNPTASDECCSFVLKLVNGGSQTVNWPASVDWAGGSAPSLTSSGTDILIFTSWDGGTIWHGATYALDSK